MEQIGQWNIYKTEDLIKTQSKSIRVDGSVGRGTITAMGNHTITATGCTDVTVNLPSEEMKPFHCPNCGGNSYRKVNGKTVCEYCDTEFIR